MLTPHKCYTVCFLKLLDCYTLTLTSLAGNRARQPRPYSLAQIDLGNPSSSYLGLNKVACQRQVSKPVLSHQQSCTASPADHQKIAHSKSTTAVVWGSNTGLDTKHANRVTISVDADSTQVLHWLFLILLDCYTLTLTSLAGNRAPQPSTYSLAQIDLGNPSSSYLGLNRVACQRQMSKPVLSHQQ